MDIRKNLSHLEFVNREHNITHLSYEREVRFFRSIMEGDTVEVDRLFEPFDSASMGRLSVDPLQNLKYHLVITVALTTRYCIEGGMEMEAAYNLSDIYIRSIDKCRTEDDINLLHREVVADFAQRMQLIHKQNHYPKAITLCLDYIYENLHTRITLEKLSEVSQLSPTYLSKLFHSEVGMTISGYITSKRIEAARNMLKYTDHSCMEISDYLCFSSESHFIQVFRKHTGHTPKTYRERFFRMRDKLAEDKKIQNSNV